MWNFGYHLARMRGRVSRQIYRSLLPLIVRCPTAHNHRIDIDVFSYSDEASLPEQIASARSFFKNVGRPTVFTIVSDGTHRPRSLKLLERLDPCVRFAYADKFVPADIAPTVGDYLTKHPIGKQLALIMSLPRSRAALYCDSDVLFFPGAQSLGSLLQETSAPAFYLPDCQFAGDERLLRDPGEAANPVNAGVLLFFQQLNWNRGLKRLQELTGPPSFFTGQTITHLVMHANGARPLDPAKFILQLDDQFVYPDYHARPEIVLRHYVNPVRHKFWRQVL
jgi:hypothetical protein